MTTKGMYSFACKDFPATIRLVQKFSGEGTVVKEHGEDEADALAKLNAWVIPQAVAFLGFTPAPITAKAIAFRPFNTPKAAKP